MYQEYCVHIDKFVWRLCVSYRQLNSVTRSFEFPISCCSDSIKFLWYSFRSLFFISLDGRSDHRQFKVRTCDQEKLAFFTPDGKHKCFVVIPFRSKMILFLHRHDEGSLKWIGHHFNDTKHVVQSDTFLANIYCNRNTIDICDMLLYSIHISTLLHYFFWVSQVFTKYRLSFKLSKYDLFLPRVEYVRHDLIAGDNCPTISKFYSSIIGLFQLMVYLFSPSLDYVLSTGIISHDINRILNLFVVFNVYITVKICQYLLGRPRLLSYSNNAKITSLHHPLSSDMIFPNQPF